MTQPGSSMGLAGRQVRAVMVRCGGFLLWVGPELPTATKADGDREGGKSTRQELDKGMESSRRCERGLGVPNTLMQLPDDGGIFAGKVECDKAVFSAGVSLALAI